MSIACFFSGLSSLKATLRRKYLSDPTEDVRIATENLLADFLREIRDVTLVQRHHEDQLKANRAAEADSAARGADGDKEKVPDITMVAPERAAFVPEFDEESVDDASVTHFDEKEGDINERDLGGKQSRIRELWSEMNNAYSVGAWPWCEN